MQVRKDIRGSYEAISTIQLPQNNRIVEICTRKDGYGDFVCRVMGYTIEGNFKVWSYGKDYSKMLHKERFRGTAKAVEQFHLATIERFGGETVILKDVEHWYSVPREAQSLGLGALCA